jgi:cyclopropane-fatty-acyl-phospholipid synthase
VTALSNEPIDVERWPAMLPVKPSPARARVVRVLLRRIAKRCDIRIAFPDGTSIGRSDAATLQVLDADQFLSRLGRDGLIGFGEAYMAGDWDSDDLVAVLTPMARELATIVPKPLQFLRGWYTKRFPASEDNDRTGARRNIARHYDLSNELFAAFLDETMTYSSAILEAPTEDLAVGQRRKVRRILDVTNVGKGSKLLEIGTGWGELALRAARRGATVTTVTLSSEQAELAQRRVEEAGVAEAVDIRIQDYRDVDGQYDAIVSVEMIEAVGEKWWPTFFRSLDARLANGGRIGLQAIVMPHDRLMASRRTWTWIHKYIFPGGLVLSEQVIDDVCAQHTSLRVVDRLHMGSSYAETLRMWRERFTARAGEIAALGFDNTFRRMWTFYLAYCEAGFRAGYLDVTQLTLARPGEA